MNKNPSRVLRMRRRAMISGCVFVYSLIISIISVTQAQTKYRISDRELFEFIALVGLISAGISLISLLLTSFNVAYGDAKKSSDENVLPVCLIRFFMNICVFLISGLLMPLIVFTDLWTRLTGKIV